MQSPVTSTRHGNPGANTREHVRFSTVGFVSGVGLLPFQNRNPYTRIARTSMMSGTKPS
jgi:hypothetical protein